MITFLIYLRKSVHIPRISLQRSSFVVYTSNQFHKLRRYIMIEEEETKGFKLFTPADITSHSENETLQTHLQCVNIS